MSDEESSPNELREELQRLRARVRELEQLAPQVDLFRTVVASLDRAPFPAYFKDQSFRYRWANQRVYSQLGKSAEKVIGQSDYELRPEFEAIELQAEDRRVIDTGQASSVTHKRSRADRQVAIEVFRIPIFDRATGFVGLIGIERDVTRQMSAIAELEVDRLLFQVLMDTLPDSIYFKDLENRFARLNRATVVKFGAANDSELVGKTDYDLFDVEHAGDAFEDEQRILETGEPVVAKEEKETWRSGKVSWVSTTKVPVRASDGRIIGTLGVTRDITVGKLAQFRLEASERRYRELVENANDIIYTHDLRGKIIAINRAAELASGYTREEAVKLHVQDLVAPRHRTLAMEMTRKKLDGIPTTTYELDLVGKDGRLIPLEVSTHVLFEEGRAVSVQGIGRDITERRRTNEALREQAKLLAEKSHALEDRNDELSAAYRNLQDAESQLIHSEKMAAIGQLVAGLAHEINNPAAFVLTNLTTIDRDLSDLLAFVAECREGAESIEQEHPELAERLREAYERLGIQEAAEEVHSLLASCGNGMNRIRDLVANLRSYSRIDTRGSFEIADLTQGLQATLVLLGPVIPKSVVVEVHADNPPAVECNLGQINQVFMNLMVNAIHAVGEQGRVDLTVARWDEGVQVSIRDTGPGISEEIRSRIFDPFFTTKEVGKGTGLGLTICQKIIDGHRGRIDFDTEPGQGTEFRIWLPIRQPLEDDDSDTPGS